MSGCEQAAKQCCDLEKMQVSVTCRVQGKVMLTILTVWFPLLMDVSTAMLPSQRLLRINSKGNNVLTAEIH